MNTDKQSAYSISVYTVRVTVSHITGDTQTPSIPQTLKESTYVFCDEHQFKEFLTGFEYALLVKAAKTMKVIDPVVEGVDQYINSKIHRGANNER